MTKPSDNLFRSLRGEKKLCVQSVFETNLNAVPGALLVTEAMPGFYAIAFQPDSGSHDFLLAADTAPSQLELFQTLEACVRFAIRRFHRKDIWLDFLGDDIPS